MSEIKLKPCPFCSGNGKLNHIHYCKDMQFDYDHDVFTIECENCGAKGAQIELLDCRYCEDFSNKLEGAKNYAIEAWNRRAGEQND